MEYTKYEVTEIREELTNEQVLLIIPEFNEIHSDGADRRVFITVKLVNNVGDWKVEIDDPSDGDVKEFFYGLLPEPIQEFCISVIRAYAAETGLTIIRGLLVNGKGVEYYDDLL